MADGTFISFGTNPENPDTGRLPGPTTRQDGIVVKEEIGEAAHSLATGGDGGWPRFTRVWSGDEHDVYVNPANVRFVTKIPLRD
jgi:hypothetical protein